MNKIEILRTTTAGNDIYYRYDLSNMQDVVRFIAREQFVWPGGYELLALMKDSGLVCSTCVKENYRLIMQSTKDGYDEQWAVCSYFADNMLDWDECSHCGKRLGYLSDED